MRAGAVSNIVGFALALAIFHSGTSYAGDSPKECSIRISRECFDLTTESGLRHLLKSAQTLIQSANSSEEARKTIREQMRRRVAPAAMTITELRAFHHEPLDLSSHKSRRALEEICARARAALATHDFAERPRFLQEIAELAGAIRNNGRSPAPERVELMQVPFLLWRYSHHAIGRAAHHPKRKNSGPTDDQSALDPDPSSFWTHPRAIASQNLYAGFGRSERLALEDQLCTYRRPKTSFGSKPGFELQCGNQYFKVKFGEPSEPFAGRIFAALGYNVEPIDHVPRLLIRYDRRIFRELNLRKPLETDVCFLRVIPLWFIRLQQHYDPFDFIAAAALKDGRRISGAELKAMLLRHRNASHPEDMPENFNSEVEQQIEYLITVPASVQPKDPAVQSVGPWDFNELDHAQRRELRGAGLLAAWIGWYDVRYDNTRLKLVRTNERTELRHFISDLGQCLGKSDTGLPWRQPESPNDFEWTFTRGPKSPPGRMSLPFRIKNYVPMERCLPFERMDLDDARWMARLIAQLSEEQIAQALAASGYDAAHVRLYTEKLISRREQMIADLGLAREFPMLRPRGTNRHFSYDPAFDGPVTVTASGWRIITIPKGQSLILRGRLRSGTNRGNAAHRLVSRD